MRTLSHVPLHCVGQPCPLFEQALLEFSLSHISLVAELTGFEPAVSCVTGRHVGPLHHSSKALVENRGFGP